MIDQNVFRYAFVCALTTVVMQSTTRGDLPLPIAEVKRDNPVDFAGEIMPLLKRNCMACHHAKEPEGGLVLETYQGILKGGDSGAGVVAKDVTASLILSRASGAEEPLMPPEDNKVGAKSLTAEELGLLKLWIEQGAPGSETPIDEPIQWQPIPASVRTIYAMAVSADGQFAACGRGNRVAIYDLSNGNEVAQLIDPDLPVKSEPGAAHVDLVQSIAFAPDGSRIATGGYRTVKFWRKVQGSLDEPPAYLATAAGLISFNADRSAVAVVNAIGDIEVWDVATRSQKQTLRGHGQEVSGLAWAGAGDRIFSCDLGGRIIAWQPSDGKQLATLEANLVPITLVSTSDGGTLSAVDADRHVRLWRFKTPPADKPDEAATFESFELEAAKPIADATAVTLSITPTPMLMVSSEAGGIQLIGLADGKLIRKIDHGGAVDAIAISDDGSQVATGGRDGKTRLWNVADGKALLTLEGDARGKIGLTTAQRDVARQKAAVARLTARTAELEKLLAKETEAVTKVTGERDKAVEALAGEEKKRVDAVAVVTATEATIAEAAADTQKSKETIEAETKKIADAKAAAEKLAQEMAVKVAAQTKANEAVAQSEKVIAEATAALNAAKAEAEKLAAEIAAQKAAIIKANEEAAKAQKAIDDANKVMADAKVLSEKSTKDLEAQKKSVADAEASKAKSEAELAKKKRAVETSTQAQQRATEAVPAHKLVVETETRRAALLEQQLVSLQNRLASPEQAIVAVTYSPDKLKIATAHQDGSTRTYRVTDGAPLSVFASSEPSAIADPVSGLVFSGDSRLCSFASAMPPRCWSLQANWILERSIGSPDQSPLSDRVTALDFRRDGLSIAVGSGPPSRSGEVKIFATETGQLVRDFGDIHSDTVLGMRFSPDGRLLASAAADKTIRVLDVAAAVEVRSLEGHTNHVLSIAWQDDGQTLASASADQNVKLWEVETGEQRRTISGFPKEITAIAFLETTNQVVTSCADGNLRLYDSSNGNAIRTFNASGDFLFSLAVTDDGKTLLAGGQDGILRVWNVADGKLVHEVK